MSEFVWLTHPDIPDSITGPQPAENPIVARLKANGWVECAEPGTEDDADVAKTEEDEPAAPTSETKPSRGRRHESTTATDAPGAGDPAGAAGDTDSDHKEV